MVTVAVWWWWWWRGGGAVAVVVWWWWQRGGGGRAVAVVWCGPAVVTVVAWRWRGVDAVAVARSGLCDFQDSLVSTVCHAFNCRLRWSKLSERQANL